jgi:hypothetical protein
MRAHSILTTFALALFAVSPATAEDQAAFTGAQTLSEEIPGGAVPGGDASKGKLVRLFKTPSQVHDGRLVVVYADAATTEEVWDPKGGQHTAADIFARYSDDDGVTWSAPVNISRTAGSYSKRTDWDGDGIVEPYWGHSEKPNIFNSGDIIVVSWIDAYVPPATWSWGNSGDSLIQGVATYPDLETYPQNRDVPYHGVYAAISYDGGDTWQYGDMSPPLQLTYGRRDAKQDVNRGAGKKWIITWQEDPEGLQQGEADGPGDGASGATAKKGTDIWYTYVPDIAIDPLALRNNRVPLSDHTTYDTTTQSGFATKTQPGDVSNHAATRANSHLVSDAGVFKAIVTYEETKGVNGVLEGKTIQYHCFPYDQPPVQGSADALSGDPGVSLTGILTNSRRVRFVRQTPNGTDPGLFIFWREGVETEGGSADIMGKVSLSVDEADVLAAPTLNLSTNTPSATPADLMVDPQADPLENALAHRAIMRGSFIAVGYSYTWNGALQRYTDLANLDFWIRTSYDGGATWSAPRNLSNLLDTGVNVKEPRLVYTAGTGTQNDDAFLAAWGTETNVYEGVEPTTPLDVLFTRTMDRGLSFEKVVPLAASSAEEFESQLRISDDGSSIYALVMSKTPAGTEAVYSRGVTVDAAPTVGTPSCFGVAEVADCPCGNPTPAGPAAGCANSTGMGGLLVGTGSESLGAADLGFTASDLPPANMTLLAYSAGYHDVLTGGAYGAGLLCLGQGVQRVAAVQASGAGTASFAGSPLWMGAAIGEQRVFQAVYRDPSGGCGAGTAFNATNSVTITYQP